MRGVPDAKASNKWGVPFYETNGRNVLALAAFKEHVGINFFAPGRSRPEVGRQRKGRRMLKVRSADDIDSVSIPRWLKAAVAANS